MCQVVPFTLPCCRHVYVAVSKLPSCPDAWPKAKCPPELCIQLGGYEPDHRGYGTCWRCKALHAGKQGYERDNLRPGLDRAIVVQGLEELNVSGRRNRVEEGGNCWFCNAKGGCKSCGASEITPVKVEQQDTRSSHDTPKKSRRRELDFEEIRSAGKRIKLEPAALPPVPAWPTAYPDPGASSSSQNNFSAPPFTQGGGANGSNHGLPQFHSPGNNGTSYALPQYATSSGISSLDGLSQYTLPPQSGQFDPFSKMPPGYWLDEVWQTGNNNAGMDNYNLNHGQTFMNHNAMSPGNHNLDPQLFQPFDFNVQAGQGDQKATHQLNSGSNQ